MRPVYLAILAGFPLAWPALADESRVSPMPELGPQVGNATKQAEARNYPRVEEICHALHKATPDGVTSPSCLGGVVFEEGARGNLEGLVTLAPGGRSAGDLDSGSAAEPFHPGAISALKSPADLQNAVASLELARELGAQRDSNLESTNHGSTEGPDLPSAVASAFGSTSEPNLPSKLLARAKEAKVRFERGDFPGAVRIYGEILAEEPDDLYTLANLGATLYRAQKLRDAVEILQKAIALAPDDSFSHRMLGIVYYQEGKYDDAIDEMTKVIAIDSKDATAHNYRGIAASQKGWSAAARRELEAATALDPKYADAHFNLAAVLARIRPPEPENAGIHYRRAIALGAKEDLGVEKLIRESAVAAGASNPAESPPESTSGQGHATNVVALSLGSGGLPPTTKELETALGHEPGVAATPFNLGTYSPLESPKENAGAGAGRVTQMVAKTDQAAEPENEASAAQSAPPAPCDPASRSTSPPNLPPELLSLAREGKEMFQRGRYAEAEQIYRQILEKAPDNLYTLSNLGVALFRAGKNKLAEKAFKKAILVAPEDGFSHCTLGIVYYQEGKYDDAVNELTKALAIDPKNATAHNYLGITASQKGWQEEGEKELEKTNELDPRDDEPLRYPEVGDFFTPLEMDRLNLQFFP